MEVRKGLDKKTSNDDFLEMANFEVKTDIGPEGLCPMLFQYEEIPPTTRKQPAATQQWRAEMIYQEREEAESEQAKKWLALGLGNHPRPSAGELCSELRKFPGGAPVWVYRTKYKTWEGAHRFISVDGETAIVQTSRCRLIFSSSCVRPQVKSQLQNV